MYKTATVLYISTTNRKKHSLLYGFQTKIITEHKKVLRYYKKLKSFKILN